MDLEIQKRARAFAEREVAPSVGCRDQDARWEPDLFRGLADARLLGAPLPREAGGEGLGATGFFELLRGFAQGSGDAGLAHAWTAHTAAALRIAGEGSAEQRRRLLPALARGEVIGASARREAGAAGDPVGISMHAVARGDLWVLDGDKPWVVNGGVAGVIVVDAVTSPSRGKDGVSTFLVGRDAAGLHADVRHRTSGLRTAVISRLTFEGVEIPRADRLGEEGAAFSPAARTCRSWERVAAYAHWLGAMRALLDETVARSRRIVDRGRPLACSQAARATLADLRIQIELAERLHARASARLDEIGAAAIDAERDVAVAGLFLARAAPWVTREAARLQGEAGVEQGTLAERLLRDVAVLAHLVEPAETLRSAIAGSLLRLAPL